jgi:hypothetical protein
MRIYDNQPRKSLRGCEHSPISCAAVPAVTIRIVIVPRTTTPTVIGFARQIAPNPAQNPVLIALLLN